MAQQVGDADALDRAARALEALATECGRQRARVAEIGAGIAPLQQRTAAVIGGTASRADRQMAGHLQSAVQRSTSAASQLARAQQVARRLAAQAHRQAAELRQEQAAAQRSGRRR